MSYSTKRQQRQTAKRLYSTFVTRSVGAPAYRRRGDKIYVPHEFITEGNDGTQNGMIQYWQSRPLTFVNNHDMTMGIARA